MIGHLNIKLNLLICIVFFGIFSCNRTTEKIDSNNVIKLKIAYLPKQLNPNSAIDNCDNILTYPKKVLKDTTITDYLFLTKFIGELNKLKVQKDIENYDFRIKCLIVKKHGTSNEVCFGEDHLIVLDGILMEDNDLIFKLLDSVLYQ